MKTRQDEIFEAANNSCPNSNNPDKFIEGALWADKNPSEELIKKILDLAWEYAASDIEVNNLTEEGELEFVKARLITSNN